MNEHSVSVSISTYNRVDLLKFAVESVLEQTYSNWELIICDDGSTDGTSEYISHLQDNRIHYIRHHKNIGKSNNMRSGFNAASGEYFIKFDDDDRLTPEFLAQTVEVLNKYPDVDFVGTDHWIIDINNVQNSHESQLCSERWGRTELDEGVVDNLLEVVFIKESFYIGATLFRRQSLQDVEYMRPNIQNCEDSDLFLRLALAEKKGYYLPKRLMEYRLHAEQQGLDRAIPFLRDQLLYLETYQFKLDKLEAFKRSRIAKAKLLLGLSLVLVGKTEEGRHLLLAGRSASFLKACTALTLSLMPLQFRGEVFKWLWNLRSKVVSR
jgi:glycosyltransferase involved in cell wall biosynthesis